MKRLIGIAGLARSGKNSFADYLCDEIGVAGGYEMQYAFADPLKRAASEMFGLPIEIFYGGDEREEIDPTWGISPREMLQKLGTEGGREVFGYDLWIKRAEYEYNNILDDMTFVITDVRFPDEAKWIKDSGGQLIIVKRKNMTVEVASHASEQGIDEHMADIIINNDGDLHDLHVSSLSVMRTLNLNAET